MEVDGLEPTTPCLQITYKTLILLTFNNLHYAQSGITRKKAATSATYTQPDFSVYSRHSRLQIHPQQQVLEARVVAEGVVTTEKAVAGLAGQS